MAANWVKISARSPTDEGGLLTTQRAGVLPNVGYRLTARVKKLEGAGRVLVGVDQPLIERECRKVGEWEKAEIDFFSLHGQRDVAAFLRVAGSGKAAFGVLGRCGGQVRH